MFCRKCGYEIPNDSEFCPKCGTAIIESNIIGESSEHSEQNNYERLQNTSHVISNAEVMGSGEDFYSGKSCGEHKIKLKEKESAKGKVKKLRIIAVLAICVIVPFVLYFSLRQFGYTKKNNGWYISRYYGSDTNVAIPTRHLGADVVGIASNAFENCKIESVTFASNSRNGKFEIDEQAFYNCRYLETVTFSSLITEAEISANAFENCISLNTVAFGGKAFRSESQMRESQKGNTKDIDYDSLSPEEAAKARGEAASKIINAKSLSQFKFDKSAFNGCTKFNDV